MKIDLTRVGIGFLLLATLTGCVGYVDGGGGGTTATTYRAPSWSWASIDGWACYPGWGEAQWQPLARTLHAVTIPLVEDITGQLSGGYLLLSGALRNLTIREGYLEKISSHFNFTITGLHSDGNPVNVSLHPRRYKEPFDLLISPSTNDMVMPGEIFLMPLIYLPKDNPEDDFTTRGLVLHPGEARGTYKKIGTFDIFEQSILQLLFFNRHTVQNQYYEEFDGTSHYTIRTL